MPMQWVEPEIAYVHNDDQIVYHVYRDDEFENRREWWFTTDVLASDGTPNQHVFDVRDLGHRLDMNEAVLNYTHSHDLKELYPIFVAAFHKGLISMPED